MIDVNVLAKNIRNVSIRSLPPWEPAYANTTQWIADRSRESPPPYDGVTWYLGEYDFDLGRRDLTLYVGLGRYTEYLFTSLDSAFRSQARPFQASLDLFPALAIGALVSTLDGKLYLARRPADALLSPERLDIPCGHPSDLECAPSDACLPSAVLSVIRRDLRCDVSFSLPTADPLPLIFVSEESSGGYDLLFHVPVRHTSEEILAAQPEGRHVMFVPNEPDAVASFLREHHPTGALSPPVLHAFAYFGLSVFGEDWFRELLSLR